MVPLIRPNVQPDAEGGGMVRDYVLDLLLRPLHHQHYRLRLSVDQRWVNLQLHWPAVRAAGTMRVPRLLIAELQRDHFLVM